MLLAVLFLWALSASAFTVGEGLSAGPKTAPAAAPGGDRDFREITWDDLIPKGWDPRSAFKGLDLSRVPDSDPRASAALEKLRDLWANAPTEPSLKGERVRIPGFLLPIERKGNTVSEFLLLPYFGACIHVPPPPANQIIQVSISPPLKNAQAMDPVWVSGILDVDRRDTPWGKAGYRMKGEKVTPYKMPAR
ncbi:DUF3299 domain-containing protein [Denitratisoma sp. agr-D3]